MQPRSGVVVEGPICGSVRAYIEAVRPAGDGTASQNSLACAEGIDNRADSAKLRVALQTVSKWRARFVANRLDGLLDAPRPGAPRTIEDSHVDAVIAKTLESMPAGATHWSTRTMAREMNLSQTAVSRIWRAFRLQPHRALN